MKLDEAGVIAHKWMRYLSPSCERIDIAGSIRRGKMEVTDIDIVCIPKIITEPDLFGNSGTQINLLEDLVYRVTLDNGAALTMNGPRHKKIALPEGIKLELWIVLPPAQWGAIFMIRTGPAEFSHWMVTPRRAGGALPSYLKEKDGSLWHGSKQIEVPEEADYFRIINMDYVEPRYRLAHWMIEKAAG